MDINTLESYSLSDFDIKKIVPNAKIIPYQHLSKIDDIVKFLKKNHNGCIIFFEEDKQGKSQIGHWEALKLIDNTIQFFDSYGLIYDGCRKWLSEQKLIQLKEFTPQLHRLLSKASEDGYKILYNHIKYQSYNKNISDCGRYSSVFLLEGDVRTFNTFMTNLVKQFKAKSYDEAITKYTNSKWKV